jgi:cytochrome P450
VARLLARRDIRLRAFGADFCIQREKDQMTLVNEAPLDQIDMSDPDLYVNGPPHEIFARLRAEAPVHWSPTGSEIEGEAPDGFWSISRYEHVVPINRDFETFSSARRSFTIRDGAAFPVDVEHSMFLGMDPPEHDHHRKIVRKVFNPKVVAAREEALRRSVKELIDGAIEQREFDLVQLVKLVPLTVTADLLGIPAEDQEKLFHWTNQFANFDDSLFRTDPEGGMKTVMEMGMYVLGLVEQRRKDPQEDLLSKLIGAEVDGEQLNDVELVADFILLMGAGVETTRNALAGGMVLLDEHRDERQKLIDDPTLVPTAADEILRYHSPFMHMARTATKDTEVGGVTIKEGEKAVLWYVSANRDEAANPDPDRFDVSREDVRQVAFGGGGIHQCLGSHLVRLELKVFFEEVLRRIPDYEISGPVRRVRSNFLHAFVEVPMSVG